MKVIQTEWSRRIPASLLTSSLVLVSGAFQAATAQTTWLGGAVGFEQDWNTAGNWDTGVPDGVNAIINTATGDFPILTATPATTPVDVIIGDGGTNSGRLDIRSGTLTLQDPGPPNGNWFLVGKGSNTAVGTLNIADTSSVGAGISGFAQGSGSINVGKLWAGGANYNDNGTGVININTTGTITANSSDGVGADAFASIILAVAYGDGNTAMGTLNLESGTIQANSQLWVGRSGEGIFNQSGGEVNSTDFFVLGRESPAAGGYSAGDGTYNMTGGTVNAATVGGNAVLGSFTGAMGELNIEGFDSEFNVGNASNFAQFVIGESGSGTVNQSDGTVNSAGYFLLGRNPGSTGIYNLSGGIVNANIEDGGALVSIGGQRGDSGGITTGGSGTLNVTGTGVFNAQRITGLPGIVVGEAWAGDTGTATGIVTVEDSGWINTGPFNAGIQLGTNAGGEGTINLDGGMISTTSIFQGAGTGTFEFNGGTLQATAGDDEFLQGLTSAKVQAGGGFIDSQEFDITINQDLVADGGGDLTKLGTGCLTLGGTNTYSGTTFADDGYLVAALPAALPASGANVQVGQFGGFGFDPAGFTDGEMATVVSNATWDLDSALVFKVDSPNTEVVSADLSGFGGGTLVLRGDGTLDLSGATLPGGLSYEAPDGGFILGVGLGVQGITVDSISSGPGTTQGINLSIAFSTVGTGNVDVWASDNLQGPGSKLATVASGASPFVDEDVLSPARFYILVSEGDGDPFTP